MDKNDLVLITAVNGYISSHVADQALATGYRVRGVVRRLDTSSWLQDHFDAKYGAGRFERVEIANYAKEGALDQHLQGVAGIIHTAVDSALTGEPEPYITNAAKSIVGVLESASKSSVKRVVYTSSSMAAVEWKIDVEWDMPMDGYNDRAIKEAYTEPFDQTKIWTVYAAAKAVAEKAAWKWIAENSPKFGFNAVLPDANFGPSLVPIHQGLPSTGGWPKMLFDGNPDFVLTTPSQHFIDVRDDAKLHVMALKRKDVENERLWGFAEPYSWNSVLAILRRLYPERKFLDDFPGLGEDLGHPPNQRAEELLKLSGQERGWTPLEQSLRDALASVV